MKILLQEKIAELEHRITALEKAQRPTTKIIQQIDLEPEISAMWKSFTALCGKAFRS